MGGRGGVTSIGGERIYCYIPIPISISNNMSDVGVSFHKMLKSMSPNSGAHMCFRIRCD